MVVENQLCGIIIAVREDVPCAYMAPIKPILEDIKQSLGCHDVRLPQYWETASQPCVPSSSKAPEVSAAVKQTVESSAGIVRRRLGRVIRRSAIGASTEAKT